MAPKLFANEESHALERGSPARGLRIGQSRGSEAHGVERREANWSAAARLRKGTHAGNTHSRERDRGRRVTEMQECPRGTVEESTL